VTVKVAVREALGKGPAEQIDAPPERRSFATPIKVMRKFMERADHRESPAQNDRFRTWAVRTRPRVRRLVGLEDEVGAVHAVRGGDGFVQCPELLLAFGYGPAPGLGLGESFDGAECCRLVLPVRIKNFGDGTEVAHAASPSSRPNSEPSVRCSGRPYVETSRKGGAKCLVAHSTMKRASSSRLADLGIFGRVAVTQPTSDSHTKMETPTLAQKLNPSRFPGMSPFMAAIVGFVLGESFTDPEIAELTVSENENVVYIRRTGAIGFDGLQSLEDLRRNWNQLLDVSGLTTEERREAVRLFNLKVETVPGTEA
jgi:hypothetical protein